MSGIILGVDGGGTKSHLAIFGSDGTCLGTAVRGPLNHECMEGSYAELETVLPEFIQSSLKNAGQSTDYVVFAAFGLAGVDTAAQHDMISDMIRGAGIRRFLLCNDGFLGVPAGCPGAVGICAINGTGSTMAAVDHSGAMIQVGGCGGITNDCGGSGWYGMRAVGLVYDELYRLGKPTVLRDMLFAEAGISRKEDYVDTISAGIANGTFDTYAVNSIVFEAAGLGDEVALDILEESAVHYAGGIIFLAGELDFPADRPLYITLAGSVFVKEKVKILPQMIERRVRGALEKRAVEFIYLDAPPVAGAVLWAAQNANFDIGMVAIRAGIAAFG